MQFCPKQFSSPRNIHFAFLNAVVFKMLIKQYLKDYSSLSSSLCSKMNLSLSGCQMLWTDPVYGLSDQNNYEIWMLKCWNQKLITNSSGVLLYFTELLRKRTSFNISLAYIPHIIWRFSSKIDIFLSFNRDGKTSTRWPVKTSSPPRTSLRWVKK